MTTPLITKSDGSKFGKSEDGNVWLDATRTSPYKFYQFWLNTSDEDAARYVKIFTTWSLVEIDALVMEHGKAPQLRRLQRELASEVTKIAHGEHEVKKAEETSEALFGNSTEALLALGEDRWTDLYDTLENPEKVESKPHPEFGLAGVSREQIEKGILMHQLLWWSGFVSSSGEARRAIKEGSISVNKEKVGDETVTTDARKLIHGKYLLLQRGRKNYFLVKVV